MMQQSKKSKEDAFLRKLLPPLLVFLIAGLLQGCVDAAISGAQVVYNHHTLQNNFKDQYTALRSSQAVYLRSDRYKDTHVSITAFNGVVVLTGQVSNKQEKEEIGEIVKNTAQVKEIYNLVNIGQPLSALTQLSDSWITAKIKTQLIAMNEIDPSKIKVITENGTVYLLGIIPPLQAKIAVNIAQKTAGVQNVVKVFSYVRISKV